MRKLKLQKRHEKASSRKGQQRVEIILNAARDILVEEGYPGMSMRKVAARCDMTVGNLSYYFASKTDLLNDLVDAVVQGYIGWWDEILIDDSLTLDQKFEAIIHFIIEDLTTVETTHFFPALWALSNHDKNVGEAMEYIYNLERGMLKDIVRQINPALSDEDSMALALYISSTMEGHTVFIGYGKPWTAYASRMANLAVKNYLHMIKTASPEDINNYKVP